MKRLYLAGPMTGIDELNFPAFNAAAKNLRDQGYEVFNPAETEPGRSREEYMRLDIRELLACEGVRVLYGWEDSSGARLEVAVAFAIGIPVLTVVGTPVTVYDLSAPKKEKADSSLEKAWGRIREIHQRKGEDYGDEATADPYANIRKASQWRGDPDWSAAISRAQDKAHRLGQYLQKGDLRNESAYDGVLDFATYGMIALALWIEAEERL